jgi:hypothetical protein
MNTGIGDAVDLSSKLAAVLAGKADRSILDTYESERISFVRTLVSTTDKLFQAVVQEGAPPNGRIAARTTRRAPLPFLPRPTPAPRSPRCPTVLRVPARAAAASVASARFALDLGSCHSCSRRLPPLSPTRSFDRARIAATSISTAIRPLPLDTARRLCRWAVSALQSAITHSEFFYSFHEGL